MVDHAARRPRAHRRGPAGRASCCGTARTRTRSRRSSSSTRATTRRFEYVATRDGAPGHPGRADVRRRRRARRTSACAPNGGGTLHRRGSRSTARRGSRSPAPIAGPRRPRDAEDRPQGLRRRRRRRTRRGSCTSASTARTASRRTSTATVEPGAARRRARLVRDAADRDARGRRRRRSAASARSSTGSTTARCRRTTGPFTIARAGEHVVEYFATDDAAEPNVEPAQDARRAGRRRRRPRPAPRSTGPAGADGPVRVHARPAGRRGGSGAVLTQYRVDGGPWQTYSAAGRADLRRLRRARSRSGRRPAPAASSCSTTARAGSRRSAGWGCSGTRSSRTGTSS